VIDLQNDVEVADFCASQYKMMMMMMMIIIIKNAHLQAYCMKQR